MARGELNLNHLRYFHVVAREGSILAASRVLHLAPSTISGQIKALEDDLGQRLIVRAGRGLVLTRFGEQVRRYADGIFELEAELTRAAWEGEARRTVRVGISSVLPKLLAREVLAPAMRPDVQLHVDEGSSEELLALLATRRLDVVISDAEMPTWMAVRAYSHLIIETGIALFAADPLAERLEHDPDALGEVPWLVPPTGTSLRQGLEAWWDELGVQPDIAAVVHDSAVLKSLGAAGHGVFAAPERVAEAIIATYHVRCIHRTDRVMERTWAITRDVVPEEPAVRVMCGLPPQAASASRA